MNSSYFIETGPSSFIWTARPPIPCEAYMVMAKLREYIDANPCKDELQQLLAPLTRLLLIEAANDERICKPDEEAQLALLQFVPDNGDRAGVEKFIRDGDERVRLTRLFQTQRYILSLTPPAVVALRDYFTRLENAFLAKLIVRSFVVDIELPPAQGYVPEEPVPRGSGAGLSIMVARMAGMRRGAFMEDRICCADDRSVFVNGKVVTRHAALISVLCARRRTVISADTLGKVQVNGSLVLDARSPVWAAEIAPVGGAFAIGTENAVVRLFDSQGAEFRRLVAHIGAVTEVAWHPNCAGIASMGDRTVRFWDIRQAETARLWTGHSHGRGRGLSVSPDGRRLAYWASDGLLRLCDIGTQDFRSVADCPPPYATRFSSDGGCVYVVTREGSVTAFGERMDLEPGRPPEVDRRAIIGPLSRHVVCGCHMTEGGILQLFASADA